MTARQTGEKMALKHKDVISEAGFKDSGKDVLQIINSSRYLTCVDN